MLRENKIYRTNSGLGYNEYVYLLYTVHGYLVIDTIGYSNSYVIGDIKPIDYFEYLELEESNYNIENSPLYCTFLFQFFLTNIHINKIKKENNARNKQTLCI